MNGSKGMPQVEKLLRYHINEINIIQRCYCETFSVFSLFAFDNSDKFLLLH